MRVLPLFFCAMEPTTASFAFCTHFVRDLLCACLDEPSLHSLHAVSCVPEDTPPVLPAVQSPSVWGSTYFLTPAAAEALWPFLTAAEPASFQAAERFEVVHPPSLTCLMTPPAVRPNKKRCAQARRLTHALASWCV